MKETWTPIHSLGQGVVGYASGKRIITPETYEQMQAMESIEAEADAQLLSLGLDKVKAVLTPPGRASITPRFDIKCYFCGKFPPKESRGVLPRDMHIRGCVFDRSGRHEVWYCSVECMLGYKEQAINKPLLEEKPTTVMDKTKPYMLGHDTKPIAEMKEYTLLHANLKSPVTDPPTIVKKVEKECDEFLKIIKEASNSF